MYSTSDNKKCACAEERNDLLGSERIDENGSLVAANGRMNVIYNSLPPSYDSIISAASHSDTGDEQLDSSYNPVVNSSSDSIRSKKLTGSCFGCSKNMFIIRYFRYCVRLFILINLVFIGLNIWLIAPHVDEYVSKSLVTKVNDVGFAGMGLKFETVDISMNADIALDYGLLNNTYLSSIFRIDGLVFKSVRIFPDNVDLKVLDTNSESEDDGDMFRLGYLKVPEMTINIEQNKTTNLDLVVTLKPDLRELFRFMQKLSDRMEQNKDHPEDLYFRMFLNTYIKLNLGSFPLLKKIPINIDRRVNLFPLIGSNLQLLHDLLNDENQKLALKNQAKIDGKNNLKDTLNWIASLISTFTFT